MPKPTKRQLKALKYLTRLGQVLIYVIKIIRDLWVVFS